MAATDPSIRCLLLTGDADEAVLIDSILAGAWGCLSLADASSEQLRLIRRALTGRACRIGMTSPTKVSISSSLMSRDTQ